MRCVRRCKGRWLGPEKMSIPSLNLFLRMASLANLTGQHYLQNCTVGAQFLMIGLTNAIEKLKRILGKAKSVKCKHLDTNTVPFTLQCSRMLHFVQSLKHNSNGKCSFKKLLLPHLDIGNVCALAIANVTWYHLIVVAGWHCLLGKMCACD